MKKCTKCKKQKNAREFGKNRSKKDGLATECNFCKKINDKKYRQKHEVKIVAGRQTYYKTIRGHLRICFYHLFRRCNNPKDIAYKYYGGRNIRCLFKSFNEFFQYVTIDLGYNNYEKIADLTIDRIDNNKSYEKGNIRFVTRKVNNRNRRSTKLTEIDVKEIRDLYISKKFNQPQLANRFNVTQANISCIVTRKTWNIA